MLQLQMSGGPLQRRRLIRKGRKKMKKLNRSELTQEQIDTCVKFLSDLDFVFTEKK